MTRPSRIVELITTLWLMVLFETTDWNNVVFPIVEFDAMLSEMLESRTRL